MNPSMLEISQDLLWDLVANAKAKAVFNQIRVSQPKEHITWIEQARQPMTRIRRLQEALRLMLRGNGCLSNLQRNKKDTAALCPFILLRKR